VAIAAACLAALSANSASAASPEVERATDGTGDVMARHGNKVGHAVRAPFADIVKLKSVHHRERLIMRTRFVELVSKPWHLLYLGVDVQTSDGKEYSGQLMYDSRHGVTSVIMLGHGLSRSCGEKALDGRANPRRATVSFIIPTRCLGNPEWIRTGASSYVVPNDYHVEWRDDARAPYRKPDPGGIYIEPTYGPEIPVGQ
jgi:hypothetical protein